MRGCRARMSPSDRKLARRRNHFVLDAGHAPFARARKSSSRPKTIDSVGQTFAQAGARPLFLSIVTEGAFERAAGVRQRRGPTIDHARTDTRRRSSRSHCRRRSAPDTEPTSVRTIDPVGHASRQPASSQCLQTSDRNTQRNGSSAFAAATARQVRLRIGQTHRSA